MLAQGGGSIINTASSLGQVAIAHQSAYVTSKHGVIGLTRAAAVEYSDKGIRVNAVLPGVIQTPMIDALEETYPGFKDALLTKHPIGRLGTPHDIAEMVAWLGSDAAACRPVALIATTSMREAEGGGPVGPRPGPSRGPKIKYLLIRTLHTGLPCAPRALRVSRPPQPTSPAHYKDSYTPLALSARPLVRLCPIGANRSSFPLAAGRCDASSADPPSIFRSTPHTPGPRRCS